MRPIPPARTLSLLGRGLLTGVLAFGTVACAGESPDDASAPERDAASTPAPALGPADGTDLPGIDLDRIQVGDEAPDFTLASFDGEPVTLSDYRGETNVLLVFYRGHW